MSSTKFKFYGNSEKNLSDKAVADILNGASPIKFKAATDNTHATKASDITGAFTTTNASSLQNKVTTQPPRKRPLDALDDDETSLNKSRKKWRLAVQKYRKIPK